jgi:ribosome-associated protein
MNAELLKEVKFLTSRSSGPGGQHVNKTESKVELHWNLEESQAMNEEQKAMLQKHLGKKLTTEGVLILYCQETRSQIKNKAIVSERFLSLIERLLKPPKKRVPTSPTRTSVEKRIKAKKEKGSRKQDRGRPGLEE